MRVLCAQDGYTPLHCAAAWGHASVVTLLCERGANKEAKDNVRTRISRPATQRMVVACSAARGGSAMTRGARRRQWWQRARGTAACVRVHGVQCVGRGRCVCARGATAAAAHRAAPRAHVVWLRVARCGAAAGGAAAAGAAAALCAVPFWPPPPHAAAAPRHRCATPRHATPRAVLHAAVAVGARACATRILAACVCRGARAHTSARHHRRRCGLPSAPLAARDASAPLPAAVLRRVRCVVLCAQDGWTPLHNAAYYGHASIVTLLCERGADKEAKDNVRTRHAHAHAHAAAHGCASCTARSGGAAGAWRAHPRLLVGASSLRLYARRRCRGCLRARAAPPTPRAAPCAHVLWPPAAAVARPCAWLWRLCNALLAGRQRAAGAAAAAVAAFALSAPAQLCSCRGAERQNADGCGR
jgi:hypothetical protein